MTNSRFSRNLTGKSTYVCGCCGRQTRDTGLGEQGCELCAFCYEAAGEENAHSDGHITDAQFAERIASLEAQYGARAHKGCCS